MGLYKRSKKFVKRTMRKVGRTIKKRYIGRKGLKLGRIVKDVSMLKTMVNAEKEIYTAHSVSNQPVYEASAYLAPITNIAEGTGHGQRDGESVKLHGYRWAIRVTQQTNRNIGGRLRFWLVKYLGPTGAVPTIGDFLKTDFDGNYTINSERNEDKYTQFSVVCSRSIYVPPDSTSGAQTRKEVHLYGRFRGRSHQRYIGTLASSLINDQMYVIAVTDFGNSASTNSMFFDSRMLVSYYDN